MSSDQFAAARVPNSPKPGGGFKIHRPRAIAMRICQRLGGNLFEPEPDMPPGADVAQQLRAKLAGRDEPDTAGPAQDEAQHLGGSGD